MFVLVFFFCCGLEQTGETGDAVQDSADRSRMFAFAVPGLASLLVPEDVRDRRAVNRVAEGFDNRHGGNRKTWRIGPSPCTDITSSFRRVVRIESVRLSATTA